MGYHAMRNVAHARECGAVMIALRQCRKPWQRARSTPGSASYGLLHGGPAATRPVELPGVCTRPAPVLPSHRSQRAWRRQLARAGAGRSRRDPGWGRRAGRSRRGPGSRPADRLRQCVPAGPPGMLIRDAYRPVRRGCSWWSQGSTRCCPRVLPRSYLAG